MCACEIALAFITKQQKHVQQFTFFFKVQNQNLKMNTMVKHQDPVSKSHTGAESFFLYGNFSGYLGREMLLDETTTFLD